MKKFIALFILLAMIIAAIPMSASAITEGDWEFQLLNNEAHITKYIGSGENVVVPSSLRGVPVTSMEEYMFSLNSIKTLELPSTIKSVPDKLCYNSYNLESVILSEGIEEIGFQAFVSCKKLKRVVLPSTIKTIGKSAFERCTVLSEITIPETIQKIGATAFFETAIKTVNLSNSKAEIGESAFNGCSMLTSASLPNNIEIIPNWLFSGCVSLKNIDIPCGVKEIGESAFGKTGITQIILPKDLKVIGGGAFKQSALVQVIVPFGVESIESYAFCNCDKLESLYIPSSVTNIQRDLVMGSKNAIVYCPENSAAYDFCVKTNTSHLIDNSADTKINVLYNGKRISFHAYNQTPEVVNNRTLVPLRSIFEAMGAAVEWDNNSNTAIAKRNGTEIKVQIGAGQIYKNGTPILVDVPAQIMNGRTMVPVRVIAESFGSKVDWNGIGNTVEITEVN